MDYRELLRKYMAFIREQEGINFLIRVDEPSWSGFTTEEFDELRKIEDEL